MNKVMIINTSSNEQSVRVLVVNLSVGSECVLQVLDTQASFSALNSSIQSLLKENSDCKTLVISQNLLCPFVLNILQQIIPEDVELLRLEDYGFSCCARKEKEVTTVMADADADFLFEWIKSKNICKVLSEIHKKLVECQNLNAIDYYLFPTQLLPYICDISRNFHRLPQVFKNDALISKYQHCYKHYNLNARCQIDGPPPVKMNCSGCRKELSDEIKQN